MSTGRPLASVPSRPSRITRVRVAAIQGRSAWGPVPACPALTPAERASVLTDRPPPIDVVVAEGSHGSGGQRLVSRPALDAPLEVVHRRRCGAPGMPNNPYDLPNASALTAIGRGPAGGRQAFGVSTAALTDHVRDSWHRRQIRLFPERVEPSHPDTQADARPTGRTVGTTGVPTSWSTRPGKPNALKAGSSYTAFFPDRTTRNQTGGKGGSGRTPASPPDRRVGQRVESVEISDPNRPR
jgi:hypothetical protein